jgi:hypothetical protein
VSRETANANRAQLLLGDSFDSVVEDNVFFEDARPVTLFGDSAGNVVAYNLFQPTGPHNDRGCKAAVFFHGHYPSENLIEGNQIGLTGTTAVGDACSITMDHIWGSQGPRNTYFRNRIENAGSSTSDAAIRVIDTNSGEITAPSINAIGNIVRNFSWGNGGAFDGPIPDAWIERNVYRNVMLLTSRAENLNNAQGNSAPTDWSTFNVPDSLYRTAPPSWWCSEACSWQGESGIGAFGDDFDQPLCSLPATLRYQGATCSAQPSSPSPLQPPQAPILLP